MAVCANAGVAAGVSHIVVDISDVAVITSTARSSIFGIE
jgi:hypothetical protein